MPDCSITASFLFLYNPPSASCSCHRLSWAPTACQAGDQGWVRHMAVLQGPKVTSCKQESELDPHPVIHIPGTSVSQSVSCPADFRCPEAWHQVSLNCEWEGHSLLNHFQFCSCQEKVSGEGGGVSLTPSQPYPSPILTESRVQAHRLPVGFNAIVLPS